MSSHDFVLVPFASADAPPDIHISGMVERRSRVLSVRYLISGNCPEIIFPARSDCPARRDGLWEATCLELFVGKQGSEQYWECNLSPSGDWNVYRFDSYRAGMQQEKLIAMLPFQVQTGQDSVLIELDLKLDRIISSDEKIEAGISAVTVSTKGRLTYWALVHPGAKPDFHCRDSFIIKI